MMNEIFGEENFVTEIVWEKRFTRSNNAKMFTTLTERILLYRRSNKVSKLKDVRDENNGSEFSNPDNDPRGVWTSVSYVNPASKTARPNLSYVLRNPITGKEVIHPTNAWKYSKDNYSRHVEQNRLYWGKNGENTYPRLKRFLSEMDDGVVPVDLWRHQDTGTTDKASKDLGGLIGRGLFDFPKPTNLIRKMMNVSGVTNDDIVLDFFSGSGTTAHAVTELNAEDGGNRRWICVQLPELTDEKSEAYKAGYRTIADIARERIRRAGAKIRADRADKLASRNVPLDLGFRAYRVDDSNFKQWNESVSDPGEIRQQALANLDPLEEGATDDDLLTELLLKRGISPLAKIEQHDNFCFIPSEKLAMCLAHSMTEEQFTTILATSPSCVIILDRAFGDDINLKVNLLLQAERQGVEVEVV